MYIIYILIPRNKKYYKLLILRTNIVDRKYIFYLLKEIYII